jgi:hypothetical protein
MMKGFGLSERRGQCRQRVNPKNKHHHSDDGESLKTPCNWSYPTWIVAHIYNTPLTVHHYFFSAFAWKD